MSNTKTVPFNTEAEEGVLACCLYNPRNVAKIADSLSPEHFYRDTHATIYTAILALYSRGKACSLPNMLDELTRANKLEEIGGRAQLMDYSDSLDTLFKVEDFAETVRRTSTMRKLYYASAEIATAALAQDDDALERAEQLITEIALNGTSKPTTTLSEALDRYIISLEERRKDFEQGITRGTPTGLVELDRILGGMHPSRLYTLAARPGFGKSAFALTVALYMAKHAKHAVFFSLEMDEPEIVERAVSAETEIDQTFLRDGDIKEDEMSRIRAIVRGMRGHDLKIDDRTYLLADIRTKARHIHMKKPLDLIVVDYLQLVDVNPSSRGKNETRTEEVAKISKGLKKLARELQVPILALAQLNREGEGQAPQLKHLGESSGIEKDSDCVMLVYCDDVEMETREKNQPYDLNIIVRKHRQGRVGTAKVRFRPRITKFQDREQLTYDAD